MINKFSYSEPKGTPKQLVVFLHGYGSNKDDLITLSEEFKSVLPDAVFVSPNAPHECEFVPDGHQWFSLEGVSLEDKSIHSKERLAEVESSIEDLNKFIDKALQEYNVSPDNLYLIGFSQGATMAIHTALIREVPAKAVLSYSGIVMDTEMNIKSKPLALGLTHGKLDDVVPFHWHDDNLKLLQKNGLNAKSLIMERAGHEIPREAIEFGKEILDEKS